MSKTLLFCATAAALAIAAPSFAGGAKSSPAAATDPATSSAAASGSPAGSAAVSTPSTSAAPAAGASMGAAASPTAGASADASARASGGFSVGMPVKDNTGATIGSISDIKTDASGQTAVIKMGTDSFSVATTGLASRDGAAVINLTQAEIKNLVQKPGT